MAFPTTPDAKPLLAFPLVLPTGWKNSPPILFTVTKTIADLADQHIHSSLEPEVYQLDDEAKAVSLPEVEKRPAMSSSFNSTPVLVALDPSLPFGVKLCPSRSYDKVTDHGVLSSWS